METKKQDTGDGLIDLYRQRFDDHVDPAERRQWLGNMKTAWLIEPLSLETLRKRAATMEVEAKYGAAVRADA